MSEDIEIRESVQADFDAIQRLYPAAFPDEDLLPLTGKLLRDLDLALSLVVCVGSSVVGHVVFTGCSIDGSFARPVLLGPLAVDPAFQRRGLGGALVRAGMDELKAGGATHVFVLGDPAYYGQFGFTAEQRIVPPYPLPREWTEAWQSVALGSVELPEEGKLAVPDPWRDPALWLP